jgi:hypothetical protein
VEVPSYTRPLRPQKAAAIIDAKVAKQQDGRSAVLEPPILPGNLPSGAPFPESTQAYDVRVLIPSEGLHGRLVKAGNEREGACKVLLLVPIPYPGAARGLIRRLATEKIRPSHNGQQHDEATVCNGSFSVDDFERTLAWPNGSCSPWPVELGCLRGGASNPGCRSSYPHP